MVTSQRNCVAPAGGASSASVRPHTQPNPAPPPRHSNIDDLVRGIGELIDTEVSGQPRNVFWRQRYPGFIETDWHGVCSLLDYVTACTLLMIRRPCPPLGGVSLA